MYKLNVKLHLFLCQTCGNCIVDLFCDIIVTYFKRNKKNKHTEEYTHKYIYKINRDILSVDISKYKNI